MKADTAQAGREFIPLFNVHWLGLEMQDVALVFAFIQNGFDAM